MAITDWTITYGGNYASSVAGTWSQEGNPGGCFKGYLTGGIPSGESGEAIITRTVDIPTGYTKVLIQADIKRTGGSGNGASIRIGGNVLSNYATPTVGVWDTITPIDITAYVTFGASASLVCLSLFEVGAVTGDAVLWDNIKLIGVI